MVRLASTEIDKMGTILSVSKPDSSYLHGLMPAIGYNIFSFGDEETNASLKEYLDNVFTSTTPLELTLNINATTILLTSHCYKEDRAFVFWKDVSTTFTAPPVRKDWGFDDLPQQEKFNEEVPQSQYDVRRFTDNLPLVVFEISLYADGHFQFGFVNKEIHTFFPGFNKEAINADNSLLFVRVHPDDKQKLLDSIKDVFKLKVWNIEYRIIEQGEIRWVRGFGRPEVESTGGKITVCTYLRDITEYKLITEKLELVDFSFRNAATPILLLLEDATFFDFNESMPAMLGYENEEFRRLTIPDIDPTFDKANCKERWVEFRKIKKATFPNRLKRKDGSFVDVEICSNLINYAGKEINYSFIIDVSEKIKLEKNLELTDFIFRNTASAITLITEDGAFYDFNEAACLLVGYTKEEYAKLSVQETNIDMNNEQFAKHWAELKKDKNAIFNTKIKKKNGEIIDIEVRANIIMYGDLELNFTIATDITEKKKLEDELKLIDFSFRRSANPMIFIKEDGSFLDFNEAAYTLLGYTELEFKQLSVPQINPHYNEKSWATRWELLKERRAFNFSTQLRKKDGTLLQVDAGANVIEFSETEINCAVITDVTEKKRLDERLRLVDFTFRNAKLPMYFLSEDGSMYDFNDEAAHQLGFSKEEFKHLKVFDFSARHTPETWKHRWQELKAGTNLPVTVKLRKKNQTFLEAEVRATMIQYEDKELCFISFLDITERNRLDEKLRLVDFAFRNASIPMYFITKDGGIYDYNSEAYKVLGSELLTFRSL